MRRAATFESVDRAWTRRLATMGLLAALAWVSACSSIGPAPRTAYPQPVAPPAEPATVAVAPAEPASSLPKPVAPTPPDVPSRVLVLRASDASSYLDVMARIEQLLDSSFEIDALSLAEPGAHATLDAGRSSWDAVIAIGADAAAAVDSEYSVPTVFCQILDYSDLVASRSTLFGVAASPPLRLQLESWIGLAPGVGSVGALIAADQTVLAEEARQAAAAVGIELKLELAASDREVLYQFRRLAASVDGFWLLPNSDILSPRVLREILDYAQTRGVHSIVFDDALLDWGGLLSVSSDSDDVAATVASVVEALLVDGGERPERITPLTAARVRVNPAVASALGIAAPAAAAPPQAGLGYRP